MRYRIQMILSIFLLCVGMVLTLSVKASAGTIEAVNSDIDDFEGIGGVAEFINDNDGYALDINTDEIDLIGGMFASAFNSLANVLFTMIKNLGHVTVVLFYQCMQFDVVSLFANQINGIQETLHNGIFEPMFILGFCGSAVIILKNMFRRDMMGAYGQILKVIGIVCLSVLLVRDSATVLSNTTAITKEAAAQALIGMQGEEAVDRTTYAAKSAAVLWEELVHVPWLFIEFGGESVDDGTAYSFLCLEPDSPERENMVKSYGGDAFMPTGSKVATKIGFSFLYLFPLIIKCAIYIIMALLSLFFQLIAIFYVLLAPVVLILTLIPGYDGLLNAWLKKILESQLSVLITSFLIGLLVKFDTMLYDMCAESWGFLVVILVQAIIDVLIIYKRNELLGTLSSLQKRMTPGYARSMMLRGIDGFSLAERGVEVTRKRVQAGAGAVGNVVGAVGDVAGGLAERGLEIYGKSAVHTVISGALEQVQLGSHNGLDEERENTDNVQRSSSVVERPVMTSGNVIPFDRNRYTNGVTSQNTITNSQEAQIEVERPRMYKNDDETKTTRIEAHRAPRMNETLAQQQIKQMQQARPNMPPIVSSIQTDEVSPQRVKSGTDDVGIPKTEVKKETLQRPTVQRPIEERPTTQKPATQKPAMQKPATQKSVPQSVAERDTVTQGTGMRRDIIHNMEPANVGSQDVRTTGHEQPQIEKPRMDRQPLEEQNSQQQSFEQSDIRENALQQQSTQRRSMRKRRNVEVISEKKDIKAPNYSHHPKETASQRLHDQQLGQVPVPRPVSSVPTNNERVRYNLSQGIKGDG